MIRSAWTPQVQAMLAPCLANTPAEYVKRCIRTGRFTVWRNPRAVMVTEKLGAALMVWAVSGQGLGECVTHAVAVARGRGCTEIRFRTERDGLPRMINRSLRAYGCTTHVLDPMAREYRICLS